MKMRKIIHYKDNGGGTICLKSRETISSKQIPCTLKKEKLRKAAIGVGGGGGGSGGLQPGAQTQQWRIICQEIAKERTVPPGATCKKRIC